MKNTIQKAGLLLELVSEKAIKFMILILCGALAWGASTATFRYPISYLEEYIQEYVDSPLKNIAVAVVVFFLFYLFQKLFFYKADEKQQKKRVFLLAVISVILTAILLSIWVTVSNLEPYWDQLEVFLTAKSFRAGDYSNMKYAYLSLYTQQYGLIFLEELLMGIWPNYLLFQYINILFICMIIFLLYRITDCLFHNQTVNLYTLAGITFFLPMHMYVTYVYGDLCSIAFSLLAVYCLIKWNENGKWRCLAIAAVGSIIAVLARTNTLIPLFAIAIVCVILSLKKWSFKPILFALILLLLPMGSTHGVQKFYELRSGNEVGKSVPSLLWIAMGMLEDGGAVGVYNGYVEAVWNSSEHNKKEATEFAAYDIQRRLEDFRQDPAYAWDFYRFKVLEQWAEPSFSSLTMTGKYTQESEGLVRFIYYGLFPDLFLRFMNYFLYILYFGAFCYAACSLRRREGILNVLLLIAVVGGFLFCILWEAKSRYMLPFAIFLLPYMARGIHMAQDTVQRLIARLFHTETSSNSTLPI